jgi:ActR/RegA family two-component response regulator/AraC-like DNA-binding protein
MRVPHPHVFHAAQAHLLWIDDEISVNDTQVRYLTHEGFFVECAATAASGLAMARTGSYAGILLDLRLPDASGLVVLTTLRAERIKAPVLVLTGFGDLESARVAGRLGAAGFKAKPIFIDDLAFAINRLLDAAPPFGDDAVDNCESASLASLLEDIHRVTVAARHSGSDSGSQEEARLGDNANKARANLMAALVRALSNVALPTRAFLACAESFRHTVTSGSFDSVLQSALYAEERILELFAKSDPADLRVTGAIAMLEDAVAKQHRPTEDEIAKAVHVDRAHLGRLMHVETGFPFRQWRKALWLKAGVRHLALTNEHVGQIACRILGYRHESQFDREFVEFFGLPPREFRRVWRACQR